MESTCTAVYISPNKCSYTGGKCLNVLAVEEQIAMSGGTMIRAPQKIIVCSDKTSSVGKLLETGTSVPIHIRNLHVLAAGLSKESKDLTPTIFSEFFSKRSVQYNLRHASEFSVPIVKILFIVTGSLSYLGPKIWDLVPMKLKRLSSLGVFKKTIKSGSIKIAFEKSWFYVIFFLIFLIFFNIYVLVPKHFMSFCIY